MIQRLIDEPFVPFGAVFASMASKGGLIPPQIIAASAINVTAIQKLMKKLYTKMLKTAAIKT